MKTADSAVHLCIYTELYSNSVSGQMKRSIIVHVTKYIYIYIYIYIYNFHFLQNRYPIMVKCSNIGKPIYRSISTPNTDVSRNLALAVVRGVLLGLRRRRTGLLPSGPAQSGNTGRVHPFIFH